MCRKNDKSFSDRSSIVFIPSSHARLAVLEMGNCGSRMQSPDPADWR